MYKHLFGIMVWQKCKKVIHKFNDYYAKPYKDARQKEIAKLN